MAPMLPVQLNVSGVAAQKQSLQSLAEQTLSITRTKIQELKAENPDRRLILVGMNSASALALQVALIEQVSGVVCFGFANNTVHGYRGQPDDMYLDLTTPTLFLIGQNAARCSEEEIETFREKITAAPTSAVIVGSADDFLRVSKTKRRLEGVTQEMIDNMIVDEISDFATKCLQRPLPAKAKMVISAVVPRREIDSSTGIPRKRKISEFDNNKVTNIKAQKIMRPTSTTSIPGASSSEEVLEMAVQSILPDHEEKIPISTIKSVPHKFTPTNRIVGVNQKMRVVSGNQFTGIKPQTVFNQGKYITITGQKNQKGMQVTQLQTRPAINNRPSTPTTQYVFNNRTTTGKIPPPQQQSFSPTKYTIRRSAPGSSGNVAYIAESADPQNILDIDNMPIVFADNEGNIAEEDASDGSVISVASDSPPSVGKQVILKTTNIVPQTSYTVTKNKNILIQKPVAGKLFMLNGTLIGKQMSASNIVIPKGNVNQPIKVQKFVPGTKIVTHQASAKPATVGKKIEILNNTIIKPAMKLQPGGHFVNLADAKSIPSARLSLPIASTANKNQIIIKTNSLKPYTGSQILPNTFGGRQLGNLTVKRLNVVPGSSIQKVFKKN